jgi:hypothetical protein
MWPKDALTLTAQALPGLSSLGKRLQAGVVRSAERLPGDAATFLFGSYYLPTAD